MNKINRTLISIEFILCLFVSVVITFTTSGSVGRSDSAIDFTWFIIPVIIAFQMSLILFHAKASKWIVPASVIDSPYYLGFLVTLTAMFLTLKGFETSGVEADFLQTIIPKFGVSLVGTAAGLSCRFLLSLVLVDEASHQARLIQQDDIRDRLYVEVEKLRDIIHKVNEAFESTRDQITNLNTDEFRSSIGEVSGQVKNLSMALNNTFFETKSLVESVHETTNKFFDFQKSSESVLAENLKRNLELLEKSRRLQDFSQSVVRNQEESIAELRNMMAAQFSVLFEITQVVTGKKPSLFRTLFKI